jgi:ABC-2 type transport system permease protein
MSRHNLRTVIAFEVRRTITKRRFWVATLIVPVLIAAVFALLVVSNHETASSIQNQKRVTFSFEVTDHSGIVDAALVKKLGGVEATSEAAGVAAVKSGRLAAYFDFPANPAKERIKVYGRDVGVFDNGRYASAAKTILQASAAARIASPDLTAITSGALKVDSTTFKGAVRSSGLQGLIPPLIYLLVFYLVIMFLGNQMLNSTLEEKENRVTEMILTTVDPTTLISGKIVSLFTAGLLQIVVFLSPVAVGYLFFRTSLNLPNLDLTALDFQVVPMVVGALLLLSGFTLFTGTLVAIGAIMPTAKEAGGFFGAMIAMLFAPFYASSLIVSHPSALIVQVFTYFPYTAPVTGMIRNGFGSLTLADEFLLVAELASFGYVALRLAVQLFRFGSIEYARKVPIRVALGLARPRRGIE